LSGAATGAAVGDADLGPPTTTPTGRKRRDASFFRGFFRQGRAFGDTCTTDAECTGDDPNSSCVEADGTTTPCVTQPCTCGCTGDYVKGVSSCETNAGDTIACPATACVGVGQICDTNCKCDTTKYKLNTDNTCDLDVSKLPYGLGTCGTEAMDYLTIPGATKETTKPDETFGSKICGSTFNVYGKYQPAAQNGAAGDIYTYMTPFMINYHTDDKEETGETGNAGYCLLYNQLPCVS